MLQNKKLKSPVKPPGSIGGAPAGTAGTAAGAVGARAGTAPGAFRHPLLRGTVPLPDGAMRGLPWTGTDDQVRVGGRAGLCTAWQDGRGQGVQLPVINIKPAALGGFRR